MTFSLTQEQQDIIQSVRNSDSVSIYAFAGAGKTSTLRAIANDNTDKRILYLAFNKAIATESATTFPKNVEVRTTNALAYKYTVGELNLGSNLMAYNYKPKEIGEIYGVKDYTEASLILSVFEAFCNSGYKAIDEESISSICKWQDGVREVYYAFLKSKYPFFSLATDDPVIVEIRNKAEKEIIDKILRTVRNLWNDMTLGKIKVTHGFYLKHFHIHLERYVKGMTYDIVLLDEAQDSNLVTLDIFTAMPGKKIIVGDPHQNIYGFRGSSNIMKKFPAKEVKYLSASFRFNNTIAGIADNILRTFKGETTPLKSAGNTVDKDGSIAHISRTNAKLIELADEFYSSRTPFNFVRNPEEIFRKTLSVYYMTQYFFRRDFEKLKLVKDNYLKSFKSIEEMTSYAEETEDRELLSALAINKKYKGDHIEILYQECINRFAEKPIMSVSGTHILTTAHGAKGLEWDDVVIEDDFPDFAELLYGGKFQSVDEFRVKLSEGKSSKSNGISEEFNLFYVACTRAKHNLRLLSENAGYIRGGESAVNYAIQKLIEDNRAVDDSSPSTNQDSYAISEKEIDDNEEVTFVCAYCGCRETALFENMMNYGLDRLLSSSGACKVCGSDDWSVRNKRGERVG